MSEDPVRDRILQAATRLFGDQGYGRTSVRDLARAAEVSNPTIYYHFGSKEGLYLETLHHHAHLNMERLRQAIQGEGSLRDRLVRMIQAQIDQAARDPAAARLLLYANHRPGGDEPQVDMLSLHQEGDQIMFELLSGAMASGELRSDLDPLDPYVVLMGIGTITAWAAMTGKELPEDTAERMIDVMYRGIQG